MLSVESDLAISDRVVSSLDGTVHSLSTHPVQPVDISLFFVKAGLYAWFDLLLMLCRRQFSLWQLVCLEFRRFQVLCPGTNTSIMQEVD
jgi:hypothetical protein